MNAMDDDASSSLQSPDEPRSFGQAISRGFSAANSTLLPAGLVFLLIVPQQILGVIAWTLMTRGALQPAEGGAPPPEIFGLIGAGCFMCLWLPVLIFTLPWVLGGALGQLHDRIARPGQQPAPLAESGRRYYLRVLALFLMLGIGMVAIHMATGVAASLAIGSPQMQPGQFDAEAIREAARHPANLVASALAAVIVAGVGVIWNLAYAAIATEGVGAIGSLARGASFARDNPGNAGKLYLVVLALTAVMYVLPQLGNFLDVEAIAGQAAVAILAALYTGYLAVLNIGLSLSVYHARRGGRGPGLAAPGPA